MAPRKRRIAQIAGAREARAIAATLGRETRATRRRRQLSQAALGERVGLGQSEISYLERGHGAGTSLETWVAIGIALDRPIAIGFSRDTIQPLQDAGHLAAQELVIRIAAAAGWLPTFETPSNPSDPRFVSDIVLTRERAVLVEVWNRLDDLGAAVRSTDRKLADLAGRREPARSCWILVDSAANRAIVRQYPAILRARFPASWIEWVRGLTGRSEPPADPGLIWADVRSASLRPLRLRPPR